MGLASTFARLLPHPPAFWRPERPEAAAAPLGRVDDPGAISGFGALDEELAQAIQPQQVAGTKTLGWRRSVLVAVALGGCVAVVLLARQLASAPPRPVG